MTNFTKVIEKYRKYSSSVASQGYKFERLMKNFLETYQLYNNLFENIWLWNDFPFKNQFGGHDVGIDLVAKTKNNEYWAIQCKCFDENTYIQKSDVDTFLSTSARSFLNENNERVNFIQRLWLSTTDKWSKNAEDALDNQTPNVIKLGLDYLNSTEVDWEKLDEGISGVNAILPKKAQKSHQIQAVESAKKYFENGNTRGKLVMACGTGKTYTSLKIAEMLAKEKFIKMLNPLSLSLNVITLMTLNVFF